MQNSSVMDHYLKLDANKSTLFCEGEWTLTNLHKLDDLITTIELPKSKSLILSGEHLKKMDSAGALRLNKLADQLRKKKYNITLENFTPEIETLFDLISEKEIPAEAPEPQKLKGLAWLGKSAIDIGSHLYKYISFIGEFTIIALALPRHIRRMHWRSFFAAIETTGYHAIPIIALLTFLIGVVLAYQMGIQLTKYGANIYIVDLLGLAVFREFGPLITAIIVAGRTGSAITAQIGAMKINEELDALRTMGVLPYELLVVPKVVALMIVVPLLTVLADIFGVFGGMMMSKHYLALSYTDFFHRFQTAVSVSSFTTGIIKAPIFGFIIATIGCFQGFQVANSADSVGKQTTTSVVQAIFYIIVVDALFSILFSYLDI